MCISSGQLTVESNRCIALALVTMLYDWFKKTRATYSTNQMQNQNQSRPGRTRFPALSVGYEYLLRVLIGSLRCLCLL